MGKSLMIMGTASSVGKSVITAGLCRVFKNRGVDVNPFKSQNMALNSFITKDGGEMGRAQVVQAEAAGKEPDILMNPILIKPSSDCDAQIIVNGKVMEYMNASEYHKYKPELRKIVTEAYKELESRSDLVILEGAGSPAEINLREGDLVNMGMAEISDSPVILVGDIDKGGVFASLYGTVKLLPLEEQKRIKGVIINKFRGDIKLLESGLKMLEDLIDIPVLGVVPWYDIDIDDEDSVTDRFKNKREGSGIVNVAILRYPHLSNFSDFAPLEVNDLLNVTYISRGEEIGNQDIIIIPGSKNVFSDYRFLKEQGWDRELIKHNRSGKLVIGICGGFQMMGKSIKDPYGVENPDNTNNELTTLGFFNMETTFEDKKVTKQSSGKVQKLDGRFSGLTNCSVNGYEIHMGRTNSSEAPFIITEENENDGAIKDNLIGTYFHGIFDNSQLITKLIATVLQEKGKSIPTEFIDYTEYKDREYNRLADLLEESLNMEAIMNIIEG